LSRAPGSEANCIFILGESAVTARGLDRLPAAATNGLADALVRALDGGELRRALAVATAGLMRELEA
jgi:hypothetical protein